MVANRYSFGRFSCESRSYVLRFGSDEVMLTPRLFDLLMMLLHHAGTVITKDELSHVLWPDQFVSDNSLSKAVSDLRRILKRYSGDAYIQTVAAIGYQFVAPVQCESGRETLIHPAVRSSARPLPSTTGC